MIWFQRRKKHGNKSLFLRQSPTPHFNGTEDENESQDRDPAPEVKDSDVPYGAAPTTSSEFDLVQTP